MKRFTFYLSILFASAVLAGTGRVHPATQPAGPSPASIPSPPIASPSFIVGVWYQPVSSFPKWKARGINTLVGYEDEGGAVTLDQYKQAAAVNGLFLILQSSVCRTQDYADPSVLAIMATPDEPDGVGNVAPADMATRYAATKLLTAKPVFINFDGWKMQYRPPADYVAYCAAADWLGMDFYPVNRGTSGAITQIGDRLDDLGLYGKGKPRIAFIETSDQDLRVQAWALDTTWGPAPAVTMRGPTSAEVTSEVTLAVAHGATAIVYFADQIGMNFEGYDGTPADVAATITTLSDGLTAAPPTTKPTTAPVDPLAGSTVQIGGHTYKLIPQ